MKKLACGLAALAVVIVSAQALTPEQTLDVRAIGERGERGGLAFSPDGSRVVFSVAEPVKGTTRARDARRPRVWMLDVTSRALTQLTTVNWRIADVEWMPDGTHLVAIASEAPASDAWNDRIYTIDAASGRFTPIGEQHGPIGELA